MEKKNDSPYALFSLVRTVWRYAGPLRWKAVLFYAMFFVANLFILAQPATIAHIVNAVERGREGTKDALLWCAAYGSTILGFWGLHGPARVIERRVAFFVYRRFTSDLYAKVTEMPLAWHQDHHTGSTINRVTKASKALFGFAQEQFIILQSFLRFTGGLVALAFYSWAVALAVAFGTVGIFFFVRRFDNRLRDLIVESNEREHRLVAGLYDYIGNIVTILTLRLHRHTRGEIRRRFDAMRDPFWKQTALNEWKWGAMSVALVFFLAFVIAAYIGGSIWFGKALVVGSVVAIFQYQLMINQIFFQLTMIAEQIMQRNMDVQAVASLLDEHEKIGIPVRDEEDIPWQSIKLEGLDFTHHEGVEAFEVLKNVRLDLKAGHKVALIGLSGAGKTTLLSLLRGLRAPDRVRVEVDGAAYATLSPLAGIATLVPQDSEIFENTILYNLTLGIEVPDELLTQALHVAAFDEVVQGLPQGLLTDIRERGVNLSGGQKQRLALARGLIAARDSSLLLLDEPTGSLDIQTESAIFNRMFEAFPKTAIVASIHRLHLLPRFDEVCLVQEGTVVEQGSFKDLLCAGGAFAALWEEHMEQQKERQV